MVSYLFILKYYFKSNLIFLCKKNSEFNSFIFNFKSSMKKIQLGGLDFEIFIPKKSIQKKTFELSQRIKNQYHGDWPVFIIVLKGAMIFANELLSYLDPNIDIVSVKVNSYDGLKSKGKVSIDHISYTKIQNRNVLIIEDIVDTGLTLNFLSNEFLNHGALSIECVTLLFKESKYQYKTKPKHIGFKVGEEFVVGHGMDYNQAGRKLKNIYKKIN